MEYDESYLKNNRGLEAGTIVTEVRLSPTIIRLGGDDWKWGTEPATARFQILEVGKFETQ